MSIRVDLSPLIAGSVVVGDAGLGVLAETIPSTGEYGPGYAYPSLEFPGDNGKEIIGRITTFPTNGTLIAFEDTSFTYVGTADTFQYQLYVDGVAVGSPQTVTLSFGDGVSGIFSGSISISLDATGESSLIEGGILSSVIDVVMSASGTYSVPNITGTLSSSIPVSMQFRDRIVLDSVNTLGDMVYQKLGVLGYDGSVQDRLKAFYIAGGATAQSNSQLEKEWLVGVSGITGKSIPQTWYEYTGSLGYTGTLNERIKEFWRNY